MKKLEELEELEKREKENSDLSVERQQKTGGLKIALICVIIGIIVVIGVVFVINKNGNNEDKSSTEFAIQNEENSTGDDDSSNLVIETEKEYNKTIYNGECVKIDLKSISFEGIKLEVKNKMENARIQVWIEPIALDCQIPSYGYANTEEIEPGDSVECSTWDEVNNVDHKYVSAVISVVNPDTSMEIEKVSIDKVDIGGNENKDEEPEGTLVYKSDYLEIKYIGATENGIELRAYNKLGQAMNIHFSEAFTVNNKEYNDNMGSGIVLPPNTAGTHFIDVGYTIKDYSVDSVKQFSCDCELIELKSDKTVESFHIDNTKPVK